MKRNKKTSLLSPGKIVVYLFVISVGIRYFENKIDPSNRWVLGVIAVGAALFLGYRFLLWTTRYKPEDDCDV